MALGLTIAGTARKPLTASLQIVDMLNERTVARLAIASVDGSYRPAVGEAVVVTDGATTVFSGQILTTTEDEIGNGSGIVTTIEAVGPDAYASRRRVTETIAAGQTLKQVLTTIVGYLSGYGVTLHPSQANGPTMEAIDWDRKEGSGCLSDLSDATNYVRKTDASKQLRMWAPGDIAAPFTLSDGTPNCEAVSVIRTRQDYYNRIYVKWTEPAVAAYAYLLLDGTNFADTEEVVVGGKTYVFQASLTDVAGHVKIGTDAADSANHLIAAITLGSGSGTDYAASTEVNDNVTAYWQSSPTLLKVRANTAGSSGNSIACTTTAAHADWVGEGSVPRVTLGYGADPALTGSVTVDDTAEQALYGLYETVVEAPLATTAAQATTIGTAMLARNDSIRETIIVTTRKAGLASGQSLVAALTKRNISDTYLITSVTITADQDETLRYVAEGEGGQYYRGSYLDTIRAWGGSGSAVSVAASAGGTGGTGLATIPLFRLLGGSSDGAVYNADGSSFVTARNYIPVVLDGDDWPGTIICRCWVKAKSGGVSVTPRVYNVTDSAAAGTATSAVTATSFTEVTFLVALASGSHMYRFELAGGTANEHVYGVGQLESA